MTQLKITDSQSLILSQRKVDQPFYLLLDPLKRISDEHELSIFTLKERLPEEHIFTIPRADLILNLSNCPHLILLAKPNQTLEESGTKDIFEASVRYARQEHPNTIRYVCGWLQTSQDPYLLTQMLAQRMFFDTRTFKNITQEQALNPDVKPHVKLYPLHQPLRLELMLCASYSVDPAKNINLPDALSQWLYPINHWMFPAANKGLFYIEGKKVDQGTTSQLPQLCAQAQADAVAVAHVLSLWLHQTTKPMTIEQMQQAPLLKRGDKALPDQAAFQCWLALKAGERYGLKNTHDLALFAMLRLITHPQFDLHPTIQQAVQLAARGQGSLSDQLNQINHHQWLAILNELR